MTLDPDAVRALTDHAQIKGKRDALRAEVQRLTAHSTTLNTIGWKIAQALGDVPAGAEQVEADPTEQVERLIAERDTLLQRLWARGEDATCRACWHSSRYHHAGRCHAHDDDPNPRPDCHCRHADLWPTALMATAENGPTT